MYIKRIEGKAEPCKELLLNKNCAVALGTFDGLHKGHMSLIDQASKYAKMHNSLSCVFTFTGCVSDTPYIASNEQRAKLLQGRNINLLLMRDFTEDFKNLSPQQFFDEYIIKMLNAKAVVVGFNYKFGYMGEGNGELLKKFCRENGIDLFIMPPVLCGDEPVSSTRIRNAVVSGELALANTMLGREFAVMGKVVHGDNIGNTLGFPTANLEIDRNHVMPPVGVYATKTEINGKIYPSVTNYGGKPTIKKGIESIETHILNYSSDLYGKTIEVRFIKKLRDIKAFKNAEELSLQLLADKNKTKELLDKLISLC